MEDTKALLKAGDELYRCAYMYVITICDLNLGYLYVHIFYVEEARRKILVTVG